MARSLPTAPMIQLFAAAGTSSLVVAQAAGMPSLQTMKLDDNSPLVTIGSQRDVKGTSDDGYLWLLEQDTQSPPSGPKIVRVSVDGARKTVGSTRSSTLQLFTTPTGVVAALIEGNETKFYRWTKPAP